MQVTYRFRCANDGQYIADSRVGQKDREKEREVYEERNRRKRGFTGVPASSRSAITVRSLSAQLPPACQ